MQSHLSRTAAVVVLISLAACGGGGGGDGPVTLGTNGLDYAVGQSLAEAEGEQMSLTNASYTPASGAQVSQGATVTLDAGFLTGGDLNGTFEINGNLVDINTGEAVVGGQTFTLIYEPNRSREYAGAIEIVVETNGIRDGETHFVFGFETNPNNLPSGSATYAGDFQVAGLLNGSDAEYEGGISFDVDFLGNVTGELLGESAPFENVGLELTEVPVVSNGFSGHLNCTSGCSGNAGNLDATFYGPNAEELGGVIAVEFGEYTGAGTFIIDRD